MEMILVKNIDVEIVPQDIVAITRMDKKNIYKPVEENEKELDALIERVHGKRFRNSKGQEFCIGFSKQVQDAIGLPFEAFDEMRKEIESLNREKNNYWLKFEYIKNYNFRDRLKYLFSGELNFGSMPLYKRRQPININGEKIDPR